MKTKTFTKTPMVYRSFWLPKNDDQKWLAAAAMAGVSRSELLRRALREKNDSILSQQPAVDQKVI